MGRPVRNRKRRSLVAIAALVGLVAGGLALPATAGATTSGPVLDNSLATPVITTPASGTNEPTPTVTVGGTASQTAAVVVTVTGNWLALAQGGSTATGQWSVPISLLQRATPYTITARELTTGDQEGPLSSAVTVSVASNDIVANGLFKVTGHSQTTLTANNLVTEDAGSTTLPGWTVFTPSVYSGLGSIDVENYLYWNSVQGKTDNSVTLAGTSAAPGGISQTVATIPGLQYTLVFWTAVNGDETPGVTHTCTVSVDGTSIAVIQQASASRPVQWKKQTYQITATSTTTNISFADITPGDTIQGPALDDVSMIPSYSLAPSNTSWETALTLTSPPPATSRALTFPGEQLWYKFPIVPGESATVDLTHVQSNDQVSLFSDITTLYHAESTPSGSLTLTQLETEDPQNSQSAEFHHGEFHNGEFHHGEFHNGEFHHGEFHNGNFYFGEFHNGEFHNGEFHHGEFHNGEFHHGGLTTTTDQDALAGSYLGTSTQQGAVTKSASATSFEDSGYFYAEVTGIDGASSPDPFTITVSTVGAACGGASIATYRTTDGYSLVTGAGSVSGAGGPYPTTVIVDDSATMPQVSPTYDATTGTATGGTGTGGIATTLAHLAKATNAAVVDVGKSKWVQAQATQAKTNAGCPFDANLEANAVQSIVNTYRNPTSPGSLKYVVIVGDDDVIPFFRYPDLEMIETETQFTTVALKSTTEAAATIANDFYRTDDQYGATANLTIGGSPVPIQTAAVGRLVETPANIAETIQNYLANPTIDPSSTLTAGYTFMAPPASQIASTFSSEGVSAATNQQLITPETVSPTTVGPPPTGSWTASTLSGDLTAKSHQLVFLGAHFNANDLLSAHKHTTVLTTTTFSGEIGTHLKDALVLSAGCHTGFTITPTDSLTKATRGLAWPQAFSAAGATLIAGTGYQYGDGNYVAASDQVYTDLAQQLGYKPAGGGPQAVGSALLSTQWRYLAGLDELNGLEEKALLQITLFGLPMLGVKMPTQTTAPGATKTLVGSANPVGSGPGKTLGLEASSITVKATYTPTLTKATDGGPLGYHQGPQGEQSDPGQAVVPVQIDDVNVKGQTLRGVGFWGGSYTDSTTAPPLTGDPVTQTQPLTPPPFSSATFYPTKITNPNYFGSIDTGSDTQLGITPIQYETNPETPSKAVERAYKTVNLRLFYSSNTTRYGQDVPALATAPTIVDPTVTYNGTQVTVTATVLSDPAAGVQQVWTTYTDPQVGSPSWTSQPLTQSPTDPTSWSVTFDDPTGSASEFMLQAANGVGEVSLDNNTGAFFTPTEIKLESTKIPPAVPSAPSAPKVSLSGNTAKVTWTAPATNGTAISGYTVTSTPQTRQCSPPTPATTECSISTLALGVPYRFSVTAANGVGTSQPSPASSPVTPIGPPGRPQEPTASPGNGKALVSWPADTTTNGTSLTGYTVTSSPGGLTCAAAPGPSPSCTVNGLTNGTSYTFTVTATNHAGTSPASPHSSGVIPFGPPGTPATPTASAGNGQATVSWPADTTTDGSPLSGYKVTSTPGGHTCTALAVANPQCTVVGLTNGTSYRFSVVAANAGGTSPPSALSTAVVPAKATTAPTITGFTPTSGSTLGGTTVTITGTNLTGATSVKFGTTAAASYTVTSATKIKAVTKAHSAGTVKISVKTAAGTATSTASFTFVTPSAPTITGFTPAGGPIAGGTTVTITGTSFSGATSVKFGTTPATTFHVTGSTKIVAKTKAQAAGNYKIRVTTPIGTATSAAYFLFAAPPTVTGFTTSGSTLGGTTVTITGTNLSGATSVNFGTTPAATFRSTGSTKIIAKAKAHAAGTVKISVTTFGGATTSTANFKFVVPPTITGFTLTSGPTSGGTTVIVTGTNFSGATSVKFGATPAASYTVTSATRIKAVTKTHSPGPFKISVTTPGGTATSTASFTFVAPPPTVTGFTPASGSTLGGTTVTITGTNLTGATAVTFGSTPATTFRVTGTTKVIAKTKAHSAGAVKISVTTPGGTATSTASFTFVVPAPTVTGFTPTSGSTSGGTTVTITGTNLTGATAVTFGSTPATTFRVTGTTKVIAKTKAHPAGAVKISVTTPGGTATSTASFTFAVPGPTITSFTPTSGSTGGGTTVTITGTDLSGATSVKFGTAPAASYTVTSATKIKAVTKSHSPGTVKISVTTAGGTATSSASFTFVAPTAPTITSFTPTSGSTSGGVTVTITGTNLSGATSVKFGYTPATTFRVTGTTKIIAKTKAQAVGTYKVRVTTPGGTATSAGSFLFAAPPTITGIAPTSGSTSGGTTVTITGTNLNGATSVKIGATTAASYTVTGTNRIIAKTQAHAAGTVKISVTTPGGAATSAANFKFVV